MQRTAAEQATPHSAPLPELPPELVVSIVRAGKDGVVLVKLLQVCKAWRRALDAEGASLWREVALAKYPRLNDLLVISGAQLQHTDFRSLYRKQYAVNRPSYPSRHPGLHEYALTVELHTGGLLRTQKVVARASERLDRLLVLENQNRYRAQLSLTKQPAFDELVGSEDGGLEKFVRVNGCFTLYATRLSDLTTTRVIQLHRCVVDPSDAEGDLGRYVDDGGERGLVFGCHAMLRRHLDMFDDTDGDGNNGLHEAVVYAAFNPTKMQLYVDFWERVLANPEQGGLGPEGEMHMVDEELQIYLDVHAPWPLD